MLSRLQLRSLLTGTLLSLLIAPAAHLLSGLRELHLPRDVLIVLDEPGHVVQGERIGLADRAGLCHFGALELDLLSLHEQVAVVVRILAHQGDLFFDILQLLPELGGHGRLLELLLGPELLLDGQSVGFETLR